MEILKTRSTTKTGYELRFRMGWLVLVVVALTFSGRLRAQTGTTAAITGTITDVSGAALARATITARNLSTGAVREVTSSDNGSYRVTPLVPGRYSLRVELSMFRAFEQPDIELSIGQVAEINANLTVGATNEVVTVTGGAPVIQTEDSSIGAVVDAPTIVNTPLNGRLGVIGLIALAPGVQSAGAQDQIPVFGVTPSIGYGNRTGYGAIGSHLDGAINMWVALQRPLGASPPLDGIAEFKVITSGAPAEFGPPSEITVVTKGGANDYHGMLVEFNRVATTAAKSYFAGALAKPKYIRNEFGGNFSGPISVPHLYNGRNRSFFFFNYEGFRLKQANNINSQQPTVAMRSGNFTGVGSGVIVDPLTGTAFPGAQIPAARLNAVSVALQNALFPLPTVAGTGVNTFELVPYSSNVDRYSFRLDHKATNKDQFRATFLAGLYGPNPATGASSRYGGSQGIGERPMNTILGWTHLFSPTLVMDMSAAYIHIPIYRTPQNVNTDFSSIIPGLGPEAINGAPQLSITNITSVSEAGSKVLSQTIQLNGSITKVTGSHTVKTGFNYAFDNNFNNVASSPARGGFSFNGQYSGIAYADFLLGYPVQTQKPTPNNFITRNYSHQFATFVQDDWRIARNLTINAGMRYEGQYFFDSPYGNGSLYVPSLQKIVIFSRDYPSATGPNPVIPGLTSLPIVFASQVGLPSSLFGYLGRQIRTLLRGLALPGNHAVARWLVARSGCSTT